MLIYVTCVYICGLGLEHQLGMQPRGRILFPSEVLSKGLLYAMSNACSLRHWVIESKHVDEAML